MKKLILKYQDLFPYVSKSTLITVHDIDVKPIKNIIQPPTGAQHVVFFLPKPNGSTRFCTEYSKTDMKN